jgi:hypothetical protein
MRRAAERLKDSALADIRLAISNDCPDELYGPDTDLTLQTLRNFLRRCIDDVALAESILQPE